MSKKIKMSKTWTAPLAYAGCSLFWILVANYLTEMSHHVAPEFEAFAHSANGVIFIVASTVFAVLITQFYRRKETSTREAFEQRDEQYRLALGHVREAAFDFDLKTRTLHWSYGMRQLLGNVEENARTNMDTFKANIHPEDRKDVLAAFQKAALKGAEFTHEFRLRTTSGSYIWIEILATVSRDTEGKPARLVGLLRDISDRKSFEMKLLSSNRSLSALAETTQLIAAEKDPAALCEKICRLLVTRAGYKAAWIGERDEHDTLQVMSAAGVPHSYFAQEPNRLQSLKAFDSPILFAARKQQTQPVVITGGAPDFAEWRSRARAQGFSGAMVLPLLLQPSHSKELRLFGTLAIFLSHGETFDENEQTILEALGRDISFALSAIINMRELDQTRSRHLQMEMRMTRALSQTISALGSKLDQQQSEIVCPNFENHAVIMAQSIGARMGLAEEQVRGLEVAAMLHDIGRLALPQEILCKPNLNEEERAVLRQHPLIGHEMLSGIDFPWPVKDVILQHHERMDGSGYPFGLKGAQICVEARIMALVDMVHGMVAQKYSQPEILAALHEPGKFDTSVVTAFVSMLNEGRLSLPLAA